MEQLLKSGCFITSRCYDAFTHVPQPASLSLHPPLSLPQMRGLLTPGCGGVGEELVGRRFPLVRVMLPVLSSSLG